MANRKRGILDKSINLLVDGETPRERDLQRKNMSNRLRRIPLDEKQILEKDLRVSLSKIKAKLGK